MKYILEWLDNGFLISKEIAYERGVRHSADGLPRNTTGVSVNKIDNVVLIRPLYKDKDSTRGFDVAVIVPLDELKNLAETLLRIAAAQD